MYGIDNKLVELIYSFDYIEHKGVNQDFSRKDILWAKITSLVDVVC